MIVPPGYGADEMSAYAVWFGWIEEYECYGYQLPNGTYFGMWNYRFE